jgi:hypothetical protein
MSVSVNIPEDLYRQASDIAAAENISVDELFASAFEERLLELERLKERAARGSYEKFLKVMSRVPAVEPPDYDRLWALIQFTELEWRGGRAVPI